MWLLLTVFFTCLFSRGSGARAGSPDSRVFSPPAVIAPPPPPPCPPQGVTTYSGPTCDVYIECVDGVRGLTECPAGLLYNPDLANDNYNDTITNTTTTTTNTTTTTQPCDAPANIDEDVLYICAPELYALQLPCAADATTSVAHSASCHKYYACVGGVLEARRCAAGKLYSCALAGEEEPCVDVLDADVLTVTDCFPLSAEPFGCSPGDTTFADYLRCDAYFECVDGRQEARRCPSGLLYDPELANSSDPCSSVFSLKVHRLLLCSIGLPDLLASPAGGVQCIGPFPHHLPDEGDNSCRSYYECREGEARYKECPGELLYDAAAPDDHFPCDYPENVSCGSGSRPLPKAPSQTPPTPSPPLPPQLHASKQLQGEETDEPKKVFNFITHVTHHW